jgi:hypothetical protein
MLEHAGKSPRAGSTFDAAVVGACETSARGEDATGSSCRQGTRDASIPQMIYKYVAPITARLAGAAALAGVSLIGCGRAAPATTAADKAAAVETSKCSATVNEDDLAPVLTGSAIENVEPLYIRVATRDSDVQGALHGALITVRPLPGMTAELLERSLECHSARATLGRVDNPTTDPFALPSSLVDISVRPEGDAFRVGVGARRSEEAHEILNRAEQLMATSR